MEGERQRSHNNMTTFYRYSTPVVLFGLVIIAGVGGAYFLAIAGSVLLGVILYSVLDQIEFNNQPPFPEIIHSGSPHCYFNGVDYPEWLQTRSGEIFYYFGLDCSQEHPRRMIENGLVYDGVVYKLALLKS